MAKKKVVKKETDSTFESSLASLEQIVRDLESGELGLEQSLDAYEVGIKRLKECHQHLQAAERRVEQLSGFDADGNPVLEPLEDRPTAGKDAIGQTTPAARGRKKTDLDETDSALF